MAKIVTREGNRLTLQVTVKLTGSLKDMEKNILDEMKWGSLAIPGIPRKPCRNLILTEVQ